MARLCSKACSASTALGRQSSNYEGSYCRFSQGELEKLDSEGRVIMTDHGAFVLVNVYGPAISTEDSAEERYAFKLQFYKVWRSCRKGRPCMHMCTAEISNAEGVHFASRLKLLPLLC